MFKILQHGKQFSKIQLQRTQRMDKPTVHTSDNQTYGFTLSLLQATRSMQHVSMYPDTQLDNHNNQPLPTRYDYSQDFSSEHTNYDSTKIPRRQQQQGTSYV